MLSIVTCLAVFDYLKAKSVAKIMIKWPNDVLANDKKVCGILIENQVQGNVLSGSVIGIGINILQTQFPIDTATSLRLLSGCEYVLANELNQVLAFLEARYIQLRQHGKSNLLADYLDVLHRLGERHQFKTNEEVFEGLILGVDDTGKLMVKTKEGVLFFGVKEIAYV